jgi:hypothetical protein
MAGTPWFALESIRTWLRLFWIVIFANFGRKMSLLLYTTNRGYCLPNVQD